MPVTHRVDDVETFRKNWKIAHVEVRCVCARGRCNSGWMASLEGRVKPLLVEFMKGKPVSLDPNQQLDLSSWATLKAFVYEAAANHPPVYEDRDRRRGGEDPQQIRGFRVVHVFDISQTEGDELPDLDAVRPKLLDADAPEGIWDALVGQGNAAGSR